MLKAVMTTWMMALTALLVAMAVADDASAANCIEQRKKYIGAITYQVIAAGDGRCWYLTGPSDKVGLFYRDYLFDDQGFILVFNSYGLGDESQTSGGREYFIFPRSHDVGMAVSTDGIRVTFASGASAFYSAQTAHWEDARGIGLVEKSMVQIGDRGGWELTPRHGVILDFGFRMGGSPSGSANGSARFVDAAGQECVVGNAEVLEWDSDGDQSLKFATDAAVRDYLRVRCPDISW